MIKDIPFERVEDIALAVVPDSVESGEEEWHVYLVNMKPDAIDGVLVSSKGYGSIEGKSCTRTNRAALQLTIQQCGML